MTAFLKAADLTQEAVHRTDLQISNLIMSSGVVIYGWKHRTAGLLIGGIGHQSSLSQKNL